MTGTDCKKCNGGWLVAYTSRRSFDGLQITRYVHCWACKAKPKPNKVTVTAPAPAKRRIRVASLVHIPSH